MGLGVTHQETAQKRPNSERLTIQSSRPLEKAQLGLGVLPDKCQRTTGTGAQPLINQPGISPLPGFCSDHSLKHKEFRPIGGCSQPEGSGAGPASLSLTF